MTEPTGTFTEIRYFPGGERVTFAFTRDHADGPETFQVTYGPDVIEEIVAILTDWLATQKATT